MSQIAAMLRHLDICNNGSEDGYLALICDQMRVGLVREDRAAILCADYPVFVRSGSVIEMALPENIRARTMVLHDVSRDLHRRGFISRWRDEKNAICSHIPLNASDGFAPAHFLMEREAASFFGLRSFGVHMNGYVRKPDGLYLWVGKRAADKQTYPGQLDHVVAGGQPAGLSLIDNLVKEAQEEAGIPTELAQKAHYAGPFSYLHETVDGLRPDRLYVFDLELPEDFTPQNEDGEVEAFTLIPAKAVLEILEKTDDFKFNCAAIIIDFLVRQGEIAHNDQLAQCLCDFRKRD